MNRRVLYALLFLVPGAVIAAIAATLATAAAAGFFWLFLFGDNTWPEAAMTGLTILFAIVFCGGLAALTYTGFQAGKKFESEPLNKKHILASVCLTFAALLIIVLHQLSVGNIGPKHPSIICNDYCMDGGYSHSGRPPEDSGDDSCICYDESGREALKIPMTSLTTSNEKN